MTGPISLIGGKLRLANAIIALFPRHKSYIEPFGGGGQVLFHKPPSEMEVFNDLDGEVINFFRICQHHHGELLRCLHYYLCSRDWFESLKKTDVKSLTDVQRAARFFYIRKLAFGGRVVNPSYGYRVTRKQCFRPGAIAPIIEATYQRLRDVQIECLPYQQILKRYDRSESLFYCDPPYWNTSYYNHNFTKPDFEEFEAALHKLKGRFIISLNDTPEVRQLFNSFTITSVALSYTLNRHKRNTARKEILIHNIPSRLKDLSEAKLHSASNK